METRNIFENLSCLDHRYSISEKEVFAKLSAYISEEASVRSCAKAESALVKAHLSIRGQLTDDVAAMLANISGSANPSATSTVLSGRQAQYLRVHLLQSTLLMALWTTLLFAHKIYAQQCNGYHSAKSNNNS
mgnify:CR=1 FL=1